MPAERPIRRFRFHGIRKLNWAERGWGSDYQAHMASAGLDGWIEPGPLLIVVGPNGGGKTTVIDLLRSLGNSSIWPTLPRENYGGDDFSGFDVEGDLFELNVRFSKYTPDLADTFDLFTTFAVASRSDRRWTFQSVLPKYTTDGEWRPKLQLFLDEGVAIETRYRSAVGPLPGDELNDKMLVALLNELSGHFPSIMANRCLEPFKLFEGDAEGPGRIGVLFKEDAGQHTFVHRSLLPVGWLQIASVIAFVRECPQRALILLDEPDRHLHPSLQRAMLELIVKEGMARQAQIVVATHSSVLVNPELGSRVGAKVVTVARGRCMELAESRSILDDLGVTSGDLVQANGILWVEGPSDRIYLKTWIEAFCRNRNEEPPIERVHYAIVSYGGALLKHLSICDGTPDKLDLRTVNRNYFVVIDSDLMSAAERPLGLEKARILAEARASGSDPSVWITDRYTIESYLPMAWPERAQSIREAAGRIEVTRITKVELAARFRSEKYDWAACDPDSSDLGEKIAQIVAAIRRWQSPQEAIEPRYLPPFLRDPDNPA
jgi:energy-coupling factor transporter ATP-binding protein EcfA2